MKDNKNNNGRNIHPGCSLAETGWNDYDDFDHPLGNFDIIPEGKEIPFVANRKEFYSCDGTYEEIEYVLSPEIQKPSQVRDESHIIIKVPYGTNPIAFLLEEKQIDITDAWVFMHSDVIEYLRKFSYKYYNKSIAYGEIFRLETITTISLQKVEHFPSWKIVHDWNIKNGETLKRREKPQRIIEVVMQN